MVDIVYTCPQGLVVQRRPHPKKEIEKALREGTPRRHSEKPKTPV
jgi:hypothetical protein